MVWKHSYQGVQENIVVLNIRIFCAQTKVFGNLNFVIPIISPFYELDSSIFSVVLQ